MDFSQNLFTKEFLVSGNRLPDYCNRLPVTKWFSKSFQMNLQRSNWFQKAVFDYNVLVINYQCVWMLKFKFKCEESHSFTIKALCNRLHWFGNRLHWFGNRLPVMVFEQIKRCNSSNSFWLFQIDFKFF